MIDTTTHTSVYPKYASIKLCMCARKALSVPLICARVIASLHHEAYLDTIVCVESGSRACGWLCLYVKWYIRAA